MNMLTMKTIEKVMMKLPMSNPAMAIDQIVLRDEIVPRENTRYWTHQLERLGELLEMPVEISDKPSIMGIPVIVSRAIPEDFVMFVMRDKTAKFLKLTPQDGGK